MVRRALREGYAAAGGTATVERLAANRECYELLSLCRSTHLLELRATLPDAPPEQERAAAGELRSRLTGHIE